MAGEGGAGRGAGRRPGEHGAHIGSDAAAIWAASPRRKGRNRNGGASGDRMGGSVRQPWTNGTLSSQSGRAGGWGEGRLVASRCLQEPLEVVFWVFTLCVFFFFWDMNGSLGRFSGAG